MTDIARASLVFFVLAAPVAAQPVRLAVTADNSIIDVGGERDFNMGAVGAIRLKSYQHHLVLKFDTAPLAGRTVLSARLRYAQNQHALRRVTVSTIQGDWAEGDSGGFGESDAGSTYNHAVHGARTAWAWPGSTFPDVVYGNANSLTSESDATVTDGFYDWAVDPDLVHANAVGAAYGLAVFESEHDVSRNPTVQSRESGNAPYLEVELGPAVDAPAAVGDLRADEETAERGEVVLRFTAPERAFAYRVLVEGVEAPRYLVPFAADAGAEQTIRIRDMLEPGVPAHISIAAVSRSGAEGPLAEVDVVASDRVVVPFPELAFEPPGSDGTRHAAGGLQVWAIPETDKLRNQGGLVDPVFPGYEQHNARFQNGRVSLAAAGGETVAFVLVIGAVGAPVGGVEVSVEPPDGIDAALTPIRSVATQQSPMPEILLAPSGAPRPPSLADLSTDDDGGQLLQLLVELDVPAGTSAGSLSALVVVAGPERIEVPVDLRVWGFELPAKPTFHMELNTYGWPDAAPTLWSVQEVARRFRSYVNVVPYSHGGRTRLDMLLPDGRRQDEAAYNDIEPGAEAGHWDDFIAGIEPVLTGDPVGGFYLAFHENWPLQMNDHRVEGEVDAYATFDEIYGATWSAVLSDFARLAGERGWHDTLFQVYLNNKQGPNNPTPWALDEPASYWDFRALDYFGGLFDAADTDVAEVDIRFRVDVSRPQYHRGYLERVGLYVCNFGALSGFPRVLDAWRRRTGGELWSYGSPNPVLESNHHVQAWALRTFALGGNGVIPWQTVGRDAGLLEGGAPEAQQLALLVIAEDDLDPVVYPSLRLAAYRRAQQDIEYLRILQDLGGYTRGQMAALIASYLSPEGGGEAYSLEAAAAIPVGGHHAGAFEGLRRHTAAAIEALLADGPPPMPDGGLTVDAGVDDAAVDDAGMDDAGAQTTDMWTDGQPSEDGESKRSDDGCGCATPGDDGTAGWLALLLLARCPRRPRAGRCRG